MREIEFDPYVAAAIILITFAVVTLAIMVLMPNKKR